MYFAVRYTRELLKTTTTTKSIKMVTLICIKTDCHFKLLLFFVFEETTFLVNSAAPVHIKIE